MKIRTRLLALFCAIAGILFLAEPARTQTQPVALVEGYVLRGDNQPVPGVTVSLVHPAVGRSSPSVTNPMGYYYFANVPLRSEPYFLEVYWGTQLLSRSTVAVGVPRLSLPPIVLP
jgi:hypothetical protein